MTDLTGKKALITGGGRGIGREIALHFARAGLNLVLAARTKNQLLAVANEGAGTPLRAEDVAETILHSVNLPPRALVREIELWATNP